MDDSHDERHMRVKRTRTRQLRVAGRLGLTLVLCLLLALPVAAGIGRPTSTCFGRGESHTDSWGGQTRTTVVNVRVTADGDTAGRIRLDAVADDGSYAYTYDLKAVDAIVTPDYAYIAARYARGSKGAPVMTGEYAYLCVHDGGDAEPDAISVLIDGDEAQVLGWVSSMQVPDGSWPGGGMLPVIEGDYTNVAYEPTRAGLVTDTRKLGDLGFNDLSYAGLLKAETALKAETMVLESETADDYLPNMNELAEADCDIVFGVGFLTADSLREAAIAYPGVYFAGIDQYHESPMPNMAGMTFRTSEASYLAGVLAGLGTLDDFDPRLNTENTIAFVGGMDLPVVEEFEAGFVTGARSVNPDVRVISVYAGYFDQPDMGEELAHYAIAQGADIVFAAAGGTGLGVARACQADGALFVGVDTDQYLTMPGFEDVALTSVIKNPENAVFDMVKRTDMDRFPGGANVSYGLAQGCVGLAPFHDFESLVPLSIRDAIAAAEADVLSGAVSVPTEREVPEFELVTEDCLTVGTSPDYPPFEFMEADEIRGFDMDLSREIAGRLGLDHAVLPYAFSELIGTLQTGVEFDMIASAMTITPERAELVDFSEPYYSGEPEGDLGFAFNKSDTLLRDSVNDALAEVRADGTYWDIYGDWFGE